MRSLLRLGAAMLALAAAPALAQWQGSLKTEDGHTVAVNPESPAAGETTAPLQELWRVGGDDEDLLLGVVGQLLHDDQGRIYVLDSQLSEIQVLSPDGEWLDTVGRAGEGPGEFRNGADMFWMPGGQIAVIQAWPGKIVLIEPDGVPAGEFKLPFREDAGFQFASRGVGDGDRIVLSGTAYTTVDDQQMQHAYLRSYDADGNELASFHEESRETRFGGFEFQERTFVDFQRRWAVAPDGRVAAALSFDDYRIHVWNRDGTLDRIIARPDHEPPARTDAEKDRFQAFFDGITRWNPGSTFRVSDTHPAVAQLFFREDGSLWVQSARDMWRPADGVYTSFDVYNREGRYVRRVHLEADADAVDDGLFLAGDRAYVVTDLMSAMMASLGAGEAGASDAEPVSVIAHAFEPPAIDLTQAD